MALPDLVWRILLQKGVQDRYETWLSDAMPKPIKQYLVPVFDQETWDHMMQAIKEALEIWKDQVIKNALEPEPGPMIRRSEWDRETSEF
jgi:hypothetical protein